ncbi:TetR/AcrR family transcriptional regulator [Streptomyces diastatochromogenes]|nr:TetR/AcrR family transcriptional regulator [Streptomyces diastatochromogenes]
MSTAQGARARARIEVTAAIKDEARRQLAAEGAAKLSLRSVARELGMVSSALYRYFPSRDELLTALIIDAYDSLGEAAEAAHATAADADHVRRWTAVCERVRAWALAHPHEYALIYGSPVPATPPPRPPSRPLPGSACSSSASSATPTGAPASPTSPPRRAAPRGRAHGGGPRTRPASQAAVALVAAWAELFGLVGFELFGQFHRVVEDRETFFRHAAARLAHGVGLRP